MKYGNAAWYTSSILFNEEEEESKPNGNDVHRCHGHTEESRQWWRTQVSTQARPNDADFQMKRWLLPVPNKKNVSSYCSRISVELIFLGFWSYWIILIKLVWLWFNGLGKGNAHWWVWREALQRCHSAKLIFGAYFKFLNIVFLK